MAETAIGPSLIEGSAGARTLDRQESDRWPMPQALMFIAGAAGVMWIMLIALVSWLVG